MRADNGGIGAEHRLQLRRKLRQAVRLHAKKNHVDRPNVFEGSGDCRSRHEISLATLHLYTALLHSAKMRAARKQGDIESSLRHACADVRADCAGPGDQEFHRRSFIGDLSSAIIHQRRGNCPPANFTGRGGRNTFHQINLAWTFVFCQKVSAVLDQCGFA